MIHPESYIYIYTYITYTVHIQYILGVHHTFGSLFWLQYIYIYYNYIYFFLFSTRPHPAERRWLHTSILTLSAHGSHDSHQTPSPWTEPLSATDHKNCEKRVHPCNRSLPCGLPFWDWVRTRAWWINSSGLESESRLLPIAFYGMKSTKPALEAWPCCVFMCFHISKLYQSSSFTQRM